MSAIVGRPNSELAGLQVPTRYRSAGRGNPVTAVYRIHLASSAAMSAARSNLEAHGFSVEDAPRSEAPTGHALDAVIQAAAGEEEASSLLDAALLTVDHDPVIEYQLQRLESFTE